MKVGDSIEIKLWGEWFHPEIIKIDKDTITVRVYEFVRGIDEDVVLHKVDIPKNTIVRPPLYS